MKTKSIVATATVAIISLSAYLYSQEASAVAVNPPVVCPKGYYSRDIRVPGQRLESHPKEGVGPVVIDNDNKDDIRYVVVAACVRPLSGAEWEEYWNISIR